MNSNINFKAFELRILCKIGDFPKEQISIEEFIERIYAEGRSYPKAVPLKEEDDYGNTEYKLKLVDHSFERIEHLTTQMRFRLEEGSGEAFYNLGYDDDGSPSGICREDVYKSICKAYINHRVFELYGNLASSNPPTLAGDARRAWTDFSTNS